MPVSIDYCTTPVLTLRPISRHSGLSPSRRRLESKLVRGGEQRLASETR